MRAQLFLLLVPDLATIILYILLVHVSQSSILGLVFTCYSFTIRAYAMRVLLLRDDWGIKCAKCRGQLGAVSG